MMHSKKDASYNSYIFINLYKTIIFAEFNFKDTRVNHKDMEFLNDSPLKNSPLIVREKLNITERNL